MGGGVEDGNEVRAPTEEETTRTRFDGDLERIGLEALRVGRTITEDLDVCLTSWALGVRISGEVDTSLPVLVGVVGSRGCGSGD